MSMAAIVKGDSRLSDFGGSGGSLLGTLRRVAESQEEMLRSQEEIGETLLHGAWWASPCKAITSLASGHMYMCVCMPVGRRASFFASFRTSQFATA
jgi:hypothetical protein